MCENRIAQGFDGLPILNVHGLNQRTASGCLDFLASALGQFLPAAAGHNVGAMLRQADCDRASQPGSSADHHRHAAAEVKQARHVYAPLPVPACAVFAAGEPKASTTAP